MFLTFIDRPSNSRFVERVWQCSNTSGGVFFSMAEGSLELVVIRVPGLTQVVLRGPVTIPAAIECPANGQWLAIRFRLGVHFPKLPTARLAGRNDVLLPTQASGHFWFEGLRWEIPTFDNAEDLVNGFARLGLVAFEHAVLAALYDEPKILSRRSVQRHVLHATGMTHVRLRQIERARFAVHRLREGSNILDVVHDAGYFDQAHLTRSLKGLIGQTPSAIAKGGAQLSFLYKTVPPA